MIPSYVPTILYPPETQAWRPEVDQQPNLQIKCLQVVHGLCKMNTLKQNQRLQFDRNYLADQKINPPGPNIMSLIENSNFPFPVKRKTLIRHFDL